MSSIKVVNTEGLIYGSNKAPLQMRTSEVCSQSRNVSSEESGVLTFDLSQHLPQHRLPPRAQMESSAAQLREPGAVERSRGAEEAKKAAAD